MVPNCCMWFRLCIAFLPIEGEFYNLYALYDCQENMEGKLNLIEF